MHRSWIAPRSVPGVRRTVRPASVISNWNGYRWWVAPVGLIPGTPRSFTWPGQAVALQDEGPESWLLDGAAGQVAERLTAELESLISLNAPVHGIDQNDQGVTVHVGNGRQIRAKRHRRHPATTAKQDHLHTRPPSGNALFSPAQSVMGSIDQGLCHLQICLLWRKANLNGFGVGNLKTLELTADSSLPSGTPGILAAFVTASAAVAFQQMTAAEQRKAVLDDLVAYWD